MPVQLGALTLKFSAQGGFEGLQIILGGEMIASICEEALRPPAKTPTRSSPGTAGPKPPRQPHPQTTNLPLGGMAERTIATALKAVGPSGVPGVRIPLPPLNNSENTGHEQGLHQNPVMWYQIWYHIGPPCRPSTGGRGRPRTPF